MKLTKKELAQRLLSGQKISIKSWDGGEYLEFIEEYDPPFRMCTEGSSDTYSANFAWSWCDEFTEWEIKQ